MSEQAPLVYIEDKALGGKCINTIQKAQKGWTVNLMMAVEGSGDTYTCNFVRSTKKKIQIAFGVLVDVKSKKADIDDKNIISLGFPMKTDISNLSAGVAEMDMAYMTELIGAFETFDADGGGEIDIGELASVMSGLGEEQSAEQLNAALKEADVDNSGTIDFVEFMNNMAGAAADDADANANIRAAFQKYDTDNSGFLEEEELRGVVSELMGKPVGDEQLKEMMQMADDNGDGKISWQEFMAVLSIS